jgi:hypothetical protein
VTGGGVGADQALLCRRAAAARRHAEQAEASAAAAVGALAEAAFVHPRTERPASRQPSTKRIRTAVRNTDKAVAAAQGTARAAGRLAAGFAAIHEPGGGPEPLWDSAVDVLRRVLLDGDDSDQVVVVLAGGDADRRVMAGLVAHAGLNPPAVLVVEVDDGRGRYVQLMSQGARSGAVVESVGDDFLDASHPITDVQRQALAERGFRPPGNDHVNWRRYQEGFSVSELADLVLGTLAEVHGAGPGNDVRITLALAAAHPDSSQEMLDLPVLDLETPTVPALARALAARLRESIDVVGIDRIWATVAQPGLPYFAHLGSNGDGGLFTEVTGNFYLDDDRLNGRQLAELRALGWDDPVDDPSDDPEIQPRNHIRIWPAPFDLETACWFVALTLAAVYGLDSGEPVLVEVGLL